MPRPDIAAIWVAFFSRRSMLGCDSDGWPLLRADYFEKPVQFKKKPKTLTKEFNLAAKVKLTSNVRAFEKSAKEAEKQDKEREKKQKQEQQAEKAAAAGASGASGGGDTVSALDQGFKFSCPHCKLQFTARGAGAHFHPQGPQDCKPYEDDCRHEVRLNSILIPF